MTIEETLEAIGNYLASLDELAGIGVVVDKQQDMEEEMKRIQSKNQGYVITVGEVSNRNGDKAKTNIGVKLKLGVTVYSPKVVRDGMKTGGSLRTVIISKLHALKVDVNSMRCDVVEYEQGKIFLEENRNKKQFMVHAMSFGVMTRYASKTEPKALGTWSTLTGTWNG